MKSVPVEGASISLDGKKVDQTTPVTLMDVPCGKHTLKVDKPLYIGKTAKITVRRHDIVEVKVHLRQNFGSVAVSTTPKDAKIEIDGKPFGQSPAKIRRLEAGIHTLRVTLPDYRDLTRRFKVAVGKNISLDLKLTPAFGHIKVTADHGKESMVFLDGDPVGAPPFTLHRIASGPHTIRVVRKLFKPFEAKVSVLDGKETTVAAVLKPDYGTLSVKSLPSGGEIRVDGKVVGKTPITLKLSSGKHDVLVSWSTPLYGKVETRVKIRPLDKHRINVKLPVQTGVLMVNTVPFAAKITLDGKPLGTAPLSLKQVPVGEHVLAAKVDGRSPVSRRIEVRKAETTVAEINLQEAGKSANRSEKTGSGGSTAVLSCRKLPGHKSALGFSSPPGVTAKRPASTRRKLAWVSAGTATAAAVASVVLFATWASKSADANSLHEEFLVTTDYQHRQDLQDRASKLDAAAAKQLTGAWIFTGAFALATGASLYLFLSEPTPPTQSAKTVLRASPLPGGGWFALEGRF